jgi:hypothetical protein
MLASPILQPTYAPSCTPQVDNLWQSGGAVYFQWHDVCNNGAGASFYRADQNGSPISHRAVMWSGGWYQYY